jgi:hypothetical protein
MVSSLKLISGGIIPIHCQSARDVPKGSRKNNFPEFAPRFGPDGVDLNEHNRRRSKAHVEDCASEDRPKLA